MLKFLQTELTMSSIELLVVLFLKHLVVDFFLQPSFMYANKGKFLHPGGHIHALLHALISMYLIYFFFRSYDASLTTLVCFGEYVVHYGMDYTKVNVCARYKWKADNSNAFWYMMGIDQTVHSLTYIAMVAVLI